MSLTAIIKYMAKQAENCRNMVRVKVWQTHTTVWLLQNYSQRISTYYTRILLLDLTYGRTMSIFAGSGISRISFYIFGILSHLLFYSFEVQCMTIFFREGVQIPLSPTLWVRPCKSFFYFLNKKCILMFLSSKRFFYFFPVIDIFVVCAFSALTLLVGRHEEHPRHVQNRVMRCWGW